MELLYLTCLLLIGGSLAEPTLKLRVSRQRVMVGDEATFTCEVRNEQASVSFKKFVNVPDGEIERYEQTVSTGATLKKIYHDTGRFDDISSEVVGSTGIDYFLRIRSANVQDTAIYSCTVDGNENVYAAIEFEVYANPTEVSFTNHSHNDIINVEEGEKYNYECVATGAVPVPRFDVYVAGEINYTRIFSHKEHRAFVPECYVQGKPEESSCLLHFRTEASVMAHDFRPDYSSDGDQLVCRATVDGSEAEPVTTQLTFNMKYRPKFRCFMKQKVALHEEDFELKCKVLCNPKLNSVSFSFTVDGVSETLSPGDESEYEDIEFLPITTNQKETEVTLKFDKIFERHYDMKFKLMATNAMGDNSTTIQLVGEDYERWSSASAVYSGIFCIITGMLSMLFLN